MLKKALLLYHTVKYLRWEQFFFRVWYKVKPLKIKPVKGEVKLNKVSWQEPFWRAASLLNSSEVFFLQQKGHCAVSSDWNNPDRPKLWLYNLHYFDGLLVKQSLDLQKIWIDRWIAENPIEQKGNGWEPYTLSLRIVNWLKWLHLNHTNDQVILNALVVQLKALEQQLEYHILANHLFANIKALLFASFWLNHPEAQQIKAKALRLFERELEEQFLVDGAHYERSPMYQGILLWDLLDILQLLRLTKEKSLQVLIEKLQSVITAALTWLQNMSHPDHKPSFFNDAAFEIAPPLTAIENYAKQLGIKVFGQNTLPRTTHLKESGFTHVAFPLHTVLFNHAEVGPPYQPGHTHADTLSLEWSVGAQRILVNGGTSEYGNGAERHRQRQTASHNTVVVNDEDSSEVWGGFRVARRAKPFDIKHYEGAEKVNVSAKHDGYRRIHPSLIHHRSLEVTANKFIIKDTVEGPFKKAYATWYIHPDISLEQVSDNTLRLDLGKQACIIMKSTAKIEMQEAVWSPTFGKQVPTKKLITALKESSIETQFTILV